MELVRSMSGYNTCQYCGKLTPHDTVECEECGRDHR